MYWLLFFYIFIIQHSFPAIIMAEDGTIPTAAATMSEQLDTQLLRRIGHDFYNKSSVSIVVTPAVFLGDLSKSSPLARQMAEELTKSLVQQGYSVIEIRKANRVIMDLKTGAKILTQDSSQLATNQVEAVAILSGTYTLTKKSVRFNMKLLHIPTNEILATTSTTLPITSEIYPLLMDKNTEPGTPSVSTKLQ